MDEFLLRKAFRVLQKRNIQSIEKECAPLGIYVGAKPILRVHQGQLVATKPQPADVSFDEIVAEVDVTVFDDPLLGLQHGRRSVPLPVRDKGGLPGHHGDLLLVPGHVFWRGRREFSCEIPDHGLLLDQAVLAHLPTDAVRHQRDEGQGFDRSLLRREIGDVPIVGRLSLSGSEC